MKIESNVQHEREVAKALLELRALYTRVSLLFPTLDLAQLLMLSGVVEQAKTAGMPKLQKTKVNLGNSGPWTGIREVGGKNARGPILVRQGKEEAPVLEAVEMILKKKGALTAPEILKAFVDNGWVVQSLQKNIVGAVRGAISNAPERFGRTGKGKSTKFHVKGLKGKPQKSAPKKAAADEEKPKLVAAMVQVITQADMGSKNLNAEDIHELLKARGWAPKSQDPVNYIRTVIGQQNKVFRRVDRGVYVLRMKAKVQVHKPAAKQPEHVNGHNAQLS